MRCYTGSQCNRSRIKPETCEESHGNGNKTQNWEWEWEGMGNHLSGNGNYLHSHGNLFPKVLYLPDANAYCAEFADYRNVIYSAPRAKGVLIYLFVSYEPV